MKVEKLKDMVGGWFVGGFFPTAFFTPDFEVCYKTHKKGEIWAPHYHKKTTEINLLIKGKMTINGLELNSGDIFIIEAYEVSFPEFLEDCELVIVKTPSDTGDKYPV